MDIPNVSLSGSSTRSPAIEIESFRPIGKHFLLRKCVNTDPDGIVLPDCVRNMTCWFRIESVSDSCSILRQSDVGFLLYVEVAVDGLHVLDDKYVVAHERAIGEGKAIRPFKVSQNGETHEL